MNPKVDAYINGAKQWKEESKFLRTILLDIGLAEDFKWMHPCYSFNEKNVVLIHGFNEYCALLFHKGVLLSDSKNLLIQQTENVQAARQLRFTNLQEIVDLQDIIKAYVFEAIEVEIAGLEVDMKDTAEFKMPEEFAMLLNNNPDLKKAFETLTPGRKRGYLLHFAQAKQPKTRIARILKFTPNILEGKGLND
jgi:uncharacterized protein YdeI (YjbR/CyaY-like superfamily)